MKKILQKIKKIKRKIQIILTNLTRSVFFFIIPKKILYYIYHTIENHYASISYLKTGKKQFRPAKNNNEKKKILFYHVSGLSFGGTEKYLQIIAKYLDKNIYDIYYMYSLNHLKDKNGNRKSYLENVGINFVEFNYDSVEKKYPFVIHGQKPDIFDIITENKIDVIFTAGAGDSTFPINIIREVPIIMISSFGAINTQENVVKHICVSQEVKSKILPVVDERKIEVLPVQSELPVENFRELGNKIREKFNIKNNEMVFGRIGRSDNNAIFDPISIEAFKNILKKYPNTHYIIMAPPPIVIQKVKEESIKNIHFIDPSSKEEDIWAFHGSINVMAHFRYDGESFGLNIAESMLAGNPIISHKSPIWNAHLEYLDESFARVTNIDDVKKYTEYMEFMIDQQKTGRLKEMGKMAKEKAERLFYIKNNIKTIYDIIHTAIQKEITK